MSLSGEQSQKRRKEDSDSSSVLKMGIWEQFDNCWSTCSRSLKACASRSPSDHPGPASSSSYSARDTS